MEVRTYGFKLSAKNKSLTLRDLFEHLEESPVKDSMDGRHERRIMVETKDGLCRGLLLSTIDSRVQCKWNTQSLKLIIEQVAAGVRLTEFNFFVINLETGEGVYQHHYRSCALKAFGEFCADIYRTRARELAAAEIERQAPTDLEETSKIREKYDGKLEWGFLVSESDAKTILDHLAKVGSIEYELNTFRKRGGEFSPVETLADRKTVRFNFSLRKDDPHKQRAIRNAIADFMTGADAFKRAVLKGVDESGEQTTVSLFDHHPAISSHSYDLVANELADITQHAFHKAPILRILGKHLKERPWAT